MLLVIDNHDSFTWNLVHGLCRWASDVHVVQSDAVSVEAVLWAKPRGIVFSPGPGRPVDAGVSLPLMRAALGNVPVLGVCLGHQVACEALGARIIRARRPLHGRTSPVTHDGRGLFTGLPSPLLVGRYHSLVVDAATLPAELEAAAFSDDGELMAVRHRRHALHAVQFHPESFLTEHGDRMLQQFVAGLSHESHQSVEPARFEPHG